MNRFLLTVALVLTASPVLAQATRTWSGNWVNRRFGTNGPLQCTARETRPGNWEASFTGTFQGDAFEYEALFRSVGNRQTLQLNGTTSIRGTRYQWTGTIRGAELRGDFRASNGDNGSFVLREVGAPASDAIPDSTMSSIGENDVTIEPVIEDGAKLLFIGNQTMAGEGDVSKYLIKALQKRNYEISAKRLFLENKTLDEMVTPRVGKALSMDGFDSVVICSGPVKAMETFNTRIKQQDGRKTVVFMAPASKHPGNGSTLARYTGATKRAIRTMRRFARQSDVLVVPSAVVFHDLTVRPPEGVSREDYLWRPNSAVPNELGTLVNSWLLMATLTGESPVAVNFDMPPFIVGQSLQSDPEMRLTRELRRELQQRVWRVAQAWQIGQTHLD